MMVEDARPLFILGGDRQLGLGRAQELGDITAPAAGQKREVRHHAQVGQLDKALGLFRALDRVVELIEQEGQADADQQAEKQAAHQDTVFVRIGWPPGSDRLAHQIDIGAADLGGDADLLEALEHAVVELLVGLDFARQHGVLHGGIFEIEGGALLLLGGGA